MFLKVNGQEYVVNFQYYKPVENPNIKLTQCVVGLVTSHEGKDYTTSLEGFGAASCHHNDNFKKATGRKIAFARALTAVGVTDKDTRRVLWTELFKQVSK